MERIIEDAFDMGIKYLTVYAFSTENWRRPKDEVDALMKLLRDYLKTCIKRANKNNMRVRVIGDVTGLAHKPKLIFLDEPTVAVDPQSRNKILEGILELNRQGTTVVYTSHYMEEVEQICSRILIMDKGRPLATGTKEELKQMIKMGEKITVDVSDLKEEELQAVRNMKHVFQADYTDGKLYVQCSGGSHNLVNVLGYLSEREVSFGRVYSELPTLNDVFLEITGKQLRD